MVALQRNAFEQGLTAVVPTIHSNKAQKTPICLHAISNRQHDAMRGVTRSTKAQSQLHLGHRHQRASSPPCA
jgi:hypothetical protein